MTLVISLECALNGWALTVTIVFNDFHIDVVSETDNRRFEFGDCAVNGLRKVSRFFRDPTINTVSGSFQNLDKRYYDIYREKNGYHLLVRFEGTVLREEVYIQNSQTEIDDEFMRTVYSS